jgi:hypothetical protein
MLKGSDLNKSWIGAASRGTTTFNAPSSLTIPYGRYKATVSGRGGSGNAPTAASYAVNYNTNYNVAYPIATQPIATQPATTWTTNYNVAYPVATQPATAWTTNYNTNYNVAYPIATQPEANRPVTSYTPGNTGTPSTVLGVYFPGGPIDLSGFSGSPGTAPYVSDTVIPYYTFPDNSNYPVAVPSGGQIVIKIE